MSELACIAPSERYNAHERGVVAAELLLAAIYRLGLDPASARFRRLAGGFQNANFLVEAGGRKLVLRFYSTGLDTARRESGALTLLRARGIPAPEPRESFELDGRPVLALEHVAGELLQDLLGSADAELFRRVGRALGRIHAIEFPRTGFLGADAQPGREFDAFAPFVRRYMDGVLDAVPPERLEPALAARLRRLLADKWELVERSEPARQLVHCDFNPKNILVAADGEPCVLDWEFCLSGNGLIDLGNFFRFADDYPERAERSFAAGYEEARGVLPRDWRAAARLLDLANMCSFLERKEDYPKTFRTARAVIADTLARFGY